MKFSTRSAIFSVPVQVFKIDLWPSSACQVCIPCCLYSPKRHATPLWPVDYSEWAQKGVLYACQSPKSFLLIAVRVINSPSEQQRQQHDEWILSNIWQHKTPADKSHCADAHKASDKDASCMTQSTRVWTKTPAGDASAKQITTADHMKHRCDGGEKWPAESWYYATVFLYPSIQ